MTATVTTSDKEADLRVAPGDGRLNPVNHIVRIVVVPRAPGSGSASQKRGNGHSHGLTDDELKVAERELKKMDAPPSSAARASSAPASPNPENMFDALKPTDIVVVGREAASVRELNPARRLCGHDDRNKDTVVRVWTESDTIEYQCDEEFQIVRVEKAGWKIYGAPNDPFGNGGPYRAQQPPGKKGLWVWRSGLLPARANNQQYKMTFKIGGVEIDPDVACGDPPPE